jgi:hypothetical protein
MKWFYDSKTFSLGVWNSRRAYLDATRYQNFALKYGGGYGIHQAEQFQVGIGSSVEHLELGMPGMWWKNGWAGKSYVRADYYPTITAAAGIIARISSVRRERICSVQSPIALFE